MVRPEPPETQKQGFCSEQLRLLAGALFAQEEAWRGLRGMCLVSEVVKPSSHLGSLDKSCCVPLFVLSCITGLRVACFNVSLFSLKAQ